MRLSKLSSIVIGVTLSGIASAVHTAEAPKETPKAAPKEEPIDPDVLRKVRKLIQGTLSSDEKEREKAWNDIRDMGNLAVPGLIGVYRQKTTKPEEVRAILIALGDSKDPRAGPALAELLASPEKMIRRDAARAIGDTGYKGGIPALEALARDVKEEEEVRLFAASAAAKLGSADALKILSELMKSEHPEIRSRAVFAMGKCGGAAQAAEIEVALADKDSSVREDAVEALRLLKQEQAWPGLIKATADSDYKIRNAAMDALKELTGQKFGNEPKAWQDWFKNGAKKELQATGRDKKVEKIEKVEKKNDDDDDNGMGGKEGKDD
jgi:HEAT repeat protein